MSDVTARITGILQEWSTRSLYVGDQSEFRSNVKLTRISSRISYNTITQHGKQYSLPTTDGYYVYSFPIQSIRSHTPKQGCSCSAVWYNGLDYLNRYQTRLYIYDNFGKMMPLSKVYLLTTCNKVYIAINKDALQTCSAKGVESSKEMFLSHWVNPHPDNPISGREYTPQYSRKTGKWVTDIASALADINSINDSLTEYTWIMVNGSQVDPSKPMNPLNEADYISIIKETDIFCKFNVPIDDNKTGYQSVIWDGYREILHMPKSLNPKGYILPHDLIDVIVTDDRSAYGLYQSRYDWRSVRQITHQDYSVDRTDVDSLRDTLHAVEITALTIVRNPVTVRYINGDVNYILDLYRNNDDTIVDLLRDASVTGVDFWSASNLEQSPYLSLIFTNTAKDNPLSGGTIPDLNYYLSSLGFYNTAKILDGGVELGIWDKSVLVASVPRILQDRTLLPYVFVNGRKLLDSKVMTQPRGRNDLALYLTDYKLTTGDKISVLLKDFTTANTAVVDVTENNTTYTLGAVNNYFYTKDGTQYKVLPKTSTTYRTDTIDGKEVVTFYKPMYGKTVYICPEDNCYKGTISLDKDMQLGKGLVYKITDKEGRPTFYYNTLDIYINGYWAIYGVDYTTYLDSDGYTVIAITNRSYLEFNVSGNTVEWFAYADVTVSDDFDYIDNGILRYTKDTFLFEKNISEVYSEGIYRNNVDDEGAYTLIPDSTDGTVGEHVLRFPYYLMSNLPRTSREEDEVRRTAISKYFKDKAPNKPAQVILHKQHAVYSPWLQSIIHGLLSGDIDYTNDPDPVAFIRQFPTFGNLRDTDPTLKRTGRMNKNYVAISASYILEYPNAPINIRTVIQKLINLTLIRDMSSLGVTPV